MKITIFFILTTFINFKVFCQSKAYDDDECSYGTQVEMNMCMYNKSLKLDSIIEARTQCLIQLMELQRTDTLDANIYDINEYINGIQLSLRESDSLWQKLKLSNAKLYHFYYEGGSAENYFLRLSHVRDAEERIRKLDDFFEILGQGSYTEIQKCK